MIPTPSLLPFFCTSISLSLSLSLLPSPSLPRAQEYTDDSGESTDPEEIAIENEYFSSKALKEDDPKGALAGFQKVLELDTKKGEWGFKALKQMLKILFRMVSIEGVEWVKIVTSCWMPEEMSV
jgi:hypothetical protein